MEHAEPQPVNRRVLSVANARAIDRQATECYGIHSLVLMEHAALALRERVLDRIRADLGSDPSLDREHGAVVLCGPGNNGGDGLALARLLAARGVKARVLLSVDPAQLQGDAAVQARTLTAMGVPLLEATAEVSRPRVVVDAVLGTGLSRAPEGGSRVLIERAVEWAAGAWVISADVPSGLDAQTGVRPGACVKADETVTFVAPKPGLLKPSAAAWVGRLVVASLELPEKLVEALTELAETDLPQA